MSESPKQCDKYDEATFLRHLRDVLAPLGSAAGRNREQDAALNTINSRLATLNTSARSHVAPKPHSIEASDPILFRMMDAWNNTFGSPLTRYAAIYRVVEADIKNAAPQVQTMDITGSPAPEPAVAALPSTTACSGDTPITDAETWDLNGSKHVPAEVSKKLERSLAACRQDFDTALRQSLEWRAKAEASAASATRRSEEDVALWSDLVVRINEFGLHPDLTEADLRQNLPPILEDCRGILLRLLNP